MEKPEGEAFTCPCCGRGAHAGFEKFIEPRVILWRCSSCRGRYTEREDAGRVILTPYKPKKLTAGQKMKMLLGL